MALRPAPATPWRAAVMEQALLVATVTAIYGVSFATLVARPERAVIAERVGTRRPR